MVYGNQDPKGGEVLIVDDVESNRLILGEIIKSMGHCPVLAEGAREALSIIQKHPPQLVLTDISMPDMDGYELCRVLKGNENTKHIPVIFISAFDNPQAIVEGLSYGGEDYITKPFVPEVIKARVDVHLRLNEARQELLEMNRRLKASVDEQLRQMELEKKNILYALANVAVKDLGEEEGYARRLSANCRILAQGMQISPVFGDKVSDDFIETVEMAAPLCDIGNIGVPKEILQKKGPLTKEEQASMQAHTTIGANLLCDLYVNHDYNDFIGISADVIRYHHENWDGSGYPDGMAGNDIPLAAQIVSTMARYTGLTGTGGAGRKEALAAMEQEAGIRTNPEIFGICSKISRQLY